MKKKKSSFYDDKEKLIKYNVKLGVLSLIKLFIFFILGIRKSIVNTSKMLIIFF